MTTIDPRQFPTRMNALLVRARSGEKGLTEEYQKVVDDYSDAKATGWVDWEDVVAIHLRMLKGWIRRAETVVA